MLCIDFVVIDFELIKSYFRGAIADCNPSSCRRLFFRGVDVGYGYHRTFPGIMIIVVGLCASILFVQ